MFGRSPLHHALDDASRARSSRLEAWLCPLALGALLLGAGCLVTDKVEYGAPNVPASVTIRSPRGSIVNLPPMSECDATLGSDGMFFRVTVSDPDVEDELDLRFIVDGVDVSNQVVGVDFPISGTEDRQVELCVSKEVFSGRPCSYVEIIVSRDFKEDQKPYGTKDPRDRGLDHVLVNGDSREVPESAKSDCYTDAGAP